MVKEGSACLWEKEDVEMVTEKVDFNILQPAHRGSPTFGDIAHNPTKVSGVEAASKRLRRAKKNNE